MLWVSSRILGGLDSVLTQHSFDGGLPPPPSVITRNSSGDEVPKHDIGMRYSLR